ncbi:MAG: DUF4252 domain-containing protein [Saprospiraceae bacterium]
MKKISILIAAILVSTFTFAQDNAIGKHFSEYQKNKDFTKVSVTSKMFSLMTEIDMDDPDEKELLEAMSKLKGIKAVVNEKTENSADLYYKAIETVGKDRSYEELMSVEDAEENIMFLVRDNGGVINELLMIVGGNNNFMVMTLFGEIDLSQIAKLSRIMKIDGMEQFQALEKK